MTSRTVVRRTLAATAVLALAAGCSARAADGPPDAAGTGPGAAASAVPSPPDDSRPGDGDTTPSARPTPPPKKEKKKPEVRETPAEVLMRQGDRGERIRGLQARLAQIGWFDAAPSGTYGRITAAAVRGFQSKRGLPPTGSVTTVTWDRLLGMTKRPTRAELDGRTVRKPKVRLDPRCLEGRVLCISKTTRTLSWVVDGTVRSTMDVRFGSQYTPTREGVFGVFLKSRDHVSTLYDTPMPYALFFSGGQAVHYSADFAADGYRGASHGCVNVRDRAAVAALFDQVRTGDKVVVHW
ncbi:L,D-transpeptidase family protein [Streptomyces qinzhouensis]|uniref:Murein L,D-transpeptidase n=1 Tax=Streptomyces qinzhouensis TaxID=2599401 RepID=A0A5B8IJI2_9ACTN|nr:L,D-transpeptidase family protein [Streptomyces qinzhouensis]QDY78652.1 murein L,D-transpeptidase [Streptomyces qinzhouensis]